MSQAQQEKLRKLTAFLERHGGHRSRWPKDQVRWVETFIETDENAEHLLAEFQALDLVLDKAPAGRFSNELEAKILAAALETKTSTPSSDNVLPFNKPRLPVNGSTDRQRYIHSPPWRWSIAAAGLAASFAFGLYLGLSGVADPTIRSAVQMAASNTAEIDEPLSLTSFGDDML